MADKVLAREIDTAGWQMIRTVGNSLSAGLGLSLGADNVARARYVDTSGVGGVHDSRSECDGDDGVGCDGVTV